MLTLTTWSKVKIRFWASATLAPLSTGVELDKTGADRVVKFRSVEAVNPSTLDDPSPFKNALLSTKT